MVKPVWISVLCVAAGAAIAQPSPPPGFVTIDEEQWVVFYDVPSRRFRDIRVAFVRQEFDRAAADLATSAGYLEIEAGRAQPALAERLSEVASRLRWIGANIADTGVTGAELDSQFGRAHWLLAQHYLAEARQARDGGELRKAGLNLFATTHHLERAVLWSNARIDRRLHNTLESLRDLAVRLQNRDQAKKALSEKPIVRAEALLRELGAVIDRPVVLVSG